MVARLHPRSPSLTSCRGHVLFEALLSLAVIGLGAIPLGMLGTVCLRWTGEQEHLTTALMRAAELAEASAMALQPPGNDALPIPLCGLAGQQERCVPDKRLAIATIESRSPTDAAGIDTMPTRLALWVAP
ncbi:hypothetical protein SGO26_12370 [Cupriavidus metallidurans]|uniref:hypothetical protein n=1 Tax=Cupriavidus TaxID=106589 RepID=UPI000311D535|nr:MULTISPECIES: hypothetical protein [Cupriavidus]HBD38226.1 hypothetical protein [Cupriavidus sp.]HBO77457.1 hypothetical protein [Cupriavidus sp.]